METLSSEQAPEQIEVSPEVKLLVSEGQEKRAGMMERITKGRVSEIAKTLAPIAPIIDVPALFAIAAKGEKFTGEKIDAGDRLSYAAAATLISLSYILYASGQHKEGLAARGVATAFSTMKFGPESYNAVLQAAKEHAPTVAPFIQNIGDLVKNNSALLEEARQSIMNVIAGNPDLIKLNLNG